MDEARRAERGKAPTRAVVCGPQAMVLFLAKIIYGYDTAFGFHVNKRLGILLMCANNIFETCFRQSAKDELTTRDIR